MKDEYPFFDNHPTIGQWLATLAAWKRVLFFVLCPIIGDIRALSLMGYERASRATPQGARQCPDEGEERHG